MYTYMVLDLKRGNYHTSYYYSNKLAGTYGSGRTNWCGSRYRT